MQRHRTNLRKDKRATSPAISTVILTGAVVVLILVAMTFANNTLGSKMAQNEYNTNQQFMQTTGQQIDDVAWTVGRTQTISYSSHYGNVKFQQVALDYTFQVLTTGGWQTLTLPGETGMILYNMPVGSYSVGNNYFERLPIGSNNSFLQYDSTAPISQVICEQRIPMSDGTYNRIALVPTMRVLTSTITSPSGSTSSNFKFYLPDLENGTNLYRSQSVTLTGSGISKVTLSGVSQVIITVSFPQTSLGFDASFFNFNRTTITLSGSSSPKLLSGSTVEFYVGKVTVALGQV
jgi:hypothetical protein